MINKIFILYKILSYIIYLKNYFLNLISFTIFHGIIILYTNSVFKEKFVCFYNFVNKEYFDIQYKMFIFLTKVRTTKTSR